METISTDALLHKMFVARGVTLAAGAFLLGVGIIGMLPVSWYLMISPLDEMRLQAIAGGTLGIIAIGSIVTCRYMYLVAFREAGSKYALGHLLICMALTPPALLGIIFIPLQVYHDIDRWRQAAEET
jgi:hypothetical protein